MSSNDPELDHHRHVLPLHRGYSALTPGVPSLPSPVISGHLVCSECQPSLVRCPICDLKYRSCLTRDFFAEKLLEHLERRCRYQHFGCEMSHKDSGQLGEHEAECEHKPEQDLEEEETRGS